MTNAARAALSRIVLFGLPCLLGSGCDLRSKAWAEETLGALPGQTMRVIDPVLDLTLAYNYGTAFSFVGDLGDARWVFGALSLVVAAALLAWALSGRLRSRAEIIGLGLIAGGGVGNGLDRLFRSAPHDATAVVDFIRINFPWGGSWPTFNVADVLVAVGVAVLLLDGIRRHRAGSDPAEGAAVFDG